MSSVGTLPAGVDPPIRAVWQGTIADDSALVVTVDAAGTFAATVNGGAATFVALDGAAVAGEICKVSLVVVPSGTVAARYYEQGAGSPANGATAGSVYVVGGGSLELSYRGRGIRRAALRIAGFADHTTASVRAAVEVQVLVWLRGLGR